MLGFTGLTFSMHTYLGHQLLLVQMTLQSWYIMAANRAEVYTSVGVCLLFSQFVRACFTGNRVALINTGGGHENYGLTGFNCVMLM